MDLATAYRRIWIGKLADIQPPHKQSIERVNQVSELWQEHFADGRLKGPLLDAGCGSGAMLAKAQGAEIQAAGVDFDGPLLEWLRSQHFYATTCDLNTDPLPTTDGTMVKLEAGAVASQAFGESYGIELPKSDDLQPGWQIVTSCDVIEHLIDPDHMLAEIYRVLAPGGHAYVSTPNAAFWRRVQQLAGGEMFRTSGDNVLRDGGHLAYFGPKDLAAAMERAGFGAVKIHYRNRDTAPPTLHRGEWSDHAYMIAVGEKRE